MAAPAIPPIRLGLIGTGLAVEKLHWPALRRLPDRYVVTTFTDRSAEQSRRFADYEVARDALTAGKDVGRLHLMAWRHTGQLVPREGRFTGMPWRQRPQYRGGVHHIAQIRLIRGDIARVHGAVRAANSTTDAPSDLTLNRAELDRRALDPAERAAVLVLDPVPGAGPVPLWRPRGSTGLFDGQPGQRISSSASFAA
jgi:predicted dehydrogenase